MSICIIRDSRQTMLQMQVKQQQQKWLYASNNRGLGCDGTLHCVVVNLNAFCDPCRSFIYFRPLWELCPMYSQHHHRQLLPFLHSGKPFSVRPKLCEFCVVPLSFSHSAKYLHSVQFVVMDSTVVKVTEETRPITKGWSLIWSSFEEYGSVQWLAYLSHWTP